MTTSRFKPSELPLALSTIADTFGRAESEYAALILIGALRLRDDAFGPISWTEAGKLVIAEAKAGREPWASFAANPFFRPQIAELVATQRHPDGSQFHFATMTDGVVEFTAIGLAALRRRQCRHCECYDGGGLDGRNKPRSMSGDCHNPRSGRFTTFGNDTCAAFVRSST